MDGTVPSSCLMPCPSLFCPPAALEARDDSGVRQGRIRRPRRRPCYGPVRRLRLRARGARRRPCCGPTRRRLPPRVGGGGVAAPAGCVTFALTPLVAAPACATATPARRPRISSASTAPARRRSVRGVLLILGMAKVLSTVARARSKRAPQPRLRSLWRRRGRRWSC